MKISVVIPCHNAGPWIQEALRSVAEQTYQPHEIIVVDDGSTDDSVEKIRSSGVKVRLLRRDYGNAAAARNAGIEVAIGDWVAFLDAEEEWDDGHLQACHDLIAGEDDIAWFAPGRNDNTATTTRAFGGLEAPQRGLSSKQLAAVVCKQKGSGFGTQGMVIRRNRLVEIRGFDESQIRRHDIDLFLRATAGRTCALYPHPTWKINSQPGGLSSNQTSCQYYHLRALLKNEAHYTDEEMTELIDWMARRAISGAIQHGTAKDVRRAWEIGRSRLRWHYRLFYGVANYWPVIVRKILRNLSRVRSVCCETGQRKHVLRRTGVS